MVGGFGGYALVWGYAFVKPWVICLGWGIWGVDLSVWLRSPRMWVNMASLGLGGFEVALVGGYALVRFFWGYALVKLVCLC